MLLFSMQLAEISGLAEKALPFFDYFFAPGFNDGHDVLQNLRGDLRTVMAEIALAGSCNPDLCSVATGGALRDVNMNRLQRIVFIGPKIDPIGANLKDLRHCQSPPPGKTGGSNALWTL